LGAPDLVGHVRQRALVVTWLFAGLRSDELVRLRVGCIRWQRADGAPAAANAHVSGDDATCLLDVPTHKTGASYTKPVDPLVGEAIALWEAQRPLQPLLVDAKTAESVAVLFCFRGRRVPPRYLNKTLIPALCHKAGVSAGIRVGQ
jgi:integrase